MMKSQEIKLSWCCTNINLEKISYLNFSNDHKNVKESISA